MSQRPLSLGFDIVHYSLSKFANGHADVVMGALVTNKDELAKHFNKQQYSNILGLRHKLHQNCALKKTLFRKNVF